MMDIKFLLPLVADATRLDILDALKQGELPVGDIVSRVGIAQSGISRHLRILHDAGVVRVRAVGQRRLYALCPEPFAELDSWISSYRALWDDRHDRFAGALTAFQHDKNDR